MWERRLACKVNFPQLPHSVSGWRQGWDCGGYRYEEMDWGEQSNCQIEAARWNKDKDNYDRASGRTCTYRCTFTFGIRCQRTILNMNGYRLVNLIGTLQLSSKSVMCQQCNYVKNVHWKIASSDLVNAIRCRELKGAKLALEGGVVFSMPCRWQQH